MILCDALKLFYSEKLSQFLTGIEPVTWTPVRFSNHWATWTQMVSEGYIYVLVLVKVFLNRIAWEHRIRSYISTELPHSTTSLISTMNRRHIETCRLAMHVSTISTNQYINVTFAHHLSPCRSMIRASHWRSEGSDSIPVRDSESFSE